MNHTATYSPEDDKIRIYPAYRLPKDEYDQLKAAGYAWAPKQECFYAVWSPSRERVALEFAEEIEDEDKSLVDRAEERAERFDGYSDNRRKDYESAHQAVKAISDNIPFGQPILVGHHSQRRAERDAQKIENGMRRAVKMWETAEYWERRAAGALAHAKYKERPDVRARRIKGLEADKRKQERYKADAEKCLAMWAEEGLTLEKARLIAGRTEAGHLPCVKHPKFDHYRSAYDVLQPQEEQYTDCDAWTVEQVQERARTYYPRQIAHADTWINHIDNRLTYERAMLQESGGTAADKYDIQIGGRVLIKGEWVTVLKINKAGGRINSLTTNRRYVSKVGIEMVQDYQPPTEDQATETAAAMKKAPLCNYPAETVGLFNRYHGTIDQYGVANMTKAEWDAKCKDYKGTRDVPATETVGKHRVRIALVPGGAYKVIYITDEKRKDPPPVETETPTIAPPTPDLAAIQARIDRASQPKTEPDPQKAEVDALKQSLKAGVQTVTAPQLFPTPPEIAARMVELAEIETGMTVLEPSAGTGNILQAIMNDDKAGAVVAVEINQALCNRLKSEYPLTDIHCFDFLTYDRGNYPVDRIIMNPPFENGADIKHIRHALEMLKPGGRLVALCANGPRQQAAFKDEAEYWEDLPAGSFANQGTGVNVAMLVLAKPKAETEPEEPETEGATDPEARLRAMWTAKGIPKERQDEIINETAKKAQPGAKVGPFVITRTATPSLRQMSLF